MAKAGSNEEVRPPLFGSDLLAEIKATGGDAELNKAFARHARTPRFGRPHNTNFNAGGGHRAGRSRCNG